MSVGTEISKMFVVIGAKTEEFTQALDGVKKQLNTAMDGFKVLTGAFVAIGAAAILAGTQTEAAMANIRTGTGATGEALQGLYEDFSEVFQVVPQNADTVSKALADLSTRTGLTGEALQELTTQMLNLGRVSKEDMNTLVADTTRVFGDWGVATEEQSEALDYLWKVSQQTGISIGELTQRLVQYGAPLRQMGFDFETAAAMLGKFEKEGVNTELVLGSLRIALTRMAQEGITDSEAALSEMIVRIKEAGTSGEANALALEMFGSRAGPDMAAAIREGRFDLDDLLETLRKSPETINAAAEETLTFSDHMAILRNEATIAMAPLGEVLIDLFKAAKPVISGLLDVLKLLVDLFSKLPTPLQTIIVGMGGIVAAVYPAKLAFDNIIVPIKNLVGVIGETGAFTTAMKFLKGTLIPGVVTAIQSLVAALATISAPVLLVIAVLTALGVAIYAIVKYWDEVKAGTVEAINVIIEAINKFTGAINRVFKTNIGQINLLEVGEDGKIRSVTNDVGEGIVETLDVSEETESVGEGIMQGLINGVKKWIAPLTRTLTAIANFAIGTFQTIFGLFSPSKVFYGFGENIMEGLVLGIESMYDQVQSAVQGIGDVAFAGVPGLDVTGRGEVQHQHNGTLKVEGVNDRGQLVDVVEIVLDELRRGDRT